MKFGSPCLFVKDVQQTIAFYIDAFGLDKKFYDPDFDFGIVMAGDAEIGIASHEAGNRMMPEKYPQPESGNPQGVELAFYSENVEDDYTKAIKAGAKPLASPYDTPWGQKVAYVESIEGTIIGICSPIDEGNNEPAK
ncbi:MAG: VOC family protein [Proteobacteria bacterium]|nr:VOC family protein [Pseudomonadota bacterium]